MLAIFAKFSNRTVFILLFTRLLAMGITLATFTPFTRKADSIRLSVVQVRQLYEEYRSLFSLPHAIQFLWKGTGGRNEMKLS